MSNDLVPYQKKPNPPVCTMREGAIVIKIWHNRSSGTSYFTTTFERVFEDVATGQLRSAKSFGLRDMSILMKLMSRARSEMEKRMLNAMK